MLCITFLFDFQSRWTISVSLLCLDGWTTGGLHYQIYGSLFGFDVYQAGDMTFSWQPEAGVWYNIAIEYNANDGTASLYLDNEYEETVSCSPGYPLDVGAAAHLGGAE